MHFVRAPDSAGASLAEAEVSHLALLNEAGHSANGVLDRHVGIDAVDVIEIDDIDLHPLKASLAGDRHVIRSAVDPTALAVGAPDVAELRGDEILMAAALDGFADK